MYTSRSPTYPSNGEVSMCSGLCSHRHLTRMGRRLHGKRQNPRYRPIKKPTNWQTHKIILYGIRKTKRDTAQPSNKPYPKQNSINANSSKITKSTYQPAYPAIPLFYVSSKPMAEKHGSCRIQSKDEPRSCEQIF